MKRMKTRRFLVALGASALLSLLFLVWMRVFGTSLAATCLPLLVAGLLSVVSIAILTFVLFCFFPYFHGDRRWFLIPSLLVVVFFIGTAFLFEVPITELGGY